MSGTMHLSMVFLLVSSVFLLEANAAMSRKRWNELFKSDAMSFATEEVFEQAHKEVKSKLIATGPDGFRKKHKRNHAMFTLQLHNCDSDCHKALVAEVGGKHKYWKRTSDIVQVSATPALMHSLSTGPLADRVLDYTPLHPSLKFASTTSNSASNCGTKKKSKKTMDFIFHIVPLSEEDLVELIANMKASLPLAIFSDEPLHPEYENLVTVKVPCSDAPSALEIITGFSEVGWIEEQGEFTFSNRWGKGICQSGASKDYSIFSANITGQSEIIGISDSGLDMMSCYFRDDNVAAPYDTVNMNHRKVIYYETYVDAVDDTTLGHGTHVCGSAAGASTEDFGSFALYNGNAPSAKISFFDIGRPDQTIKIPDNVDLGLLERLYVTGARVFTNSWGAVVVDDNGVYYPSGNDYTSYARSVDTFMLRHPDALVLFSAGNYGDYGPNTVTSPSTNKNGISVGASLNDNDAWKSYVGQDNAKSVFDPNGVAYFSGIGPTRDFRLKPDIVAPGYPIYSAKISSSTPREETCAVFALQGTSMASPTAAGVAILVRQYFMEGFYPSGRKLPADGFVPSGALLKAILVQSGVPMLRTVVFDGSSSAIEYPSNDQGYGRITVGNVLNFGIPAEGEFISLFVRGGATSSDKYYVSFQSEGEEHVYFFNTGPLEEQHPIRITVAFTDETPANSANMANVNTFSLLATNLNTSATHSPYTIGGSTTSNNVMVIDIDNPTFNSTYMVVMTSTSVLASEQPYAIVISGEISTSESLLNDTSSSASVNHDSIGITSSLLTSIFVIVLACLILLISIFAMHRENVADEKKKLRNQKRQSSLYKGV